LLTVFPAYFRSRDYDVADAVDFVVSVYAPLQPTADHVNYDSLYVTTSSKSPDTDRMSVKVTECARAAVQNTATPLECRRQLEKFQPISDTHLQIPSQPSGTYILSHRYKRWEI